jgi:predicted ATPase
MDRIFFEGIRCFAFRQEVPLAPLTVLVGENSSGKSTFLALVRLAWDLVKNPETPNFNEEPFLLGAYEQIAARSGQKVQQSFVIGFQGSVFRVEARFEAQAGQPSLSDWHLEGPEGLSLPFPTEIKAEDRQRLLSVLYRILDNLGARPYAFAPVRTRPQRTYDPIKGAERPEGSHVPMILASAPFLEPDKWTGLFSALDAFGQHSGLFKKVEVRRLGKSEGDPFQIQVYVGGNLVNLIDVGYGVSQVLPIIVDCLRGEDGGTFLLQQPEVHLHPRAQAELGSFLGVLAKQQKKRFVIETHSDYLVDRIRMDIRDRKGLTPEDVSLLYFERKNGDANIHRLTIDEQGNILDPPPGFRSFFLEEERRFLGG